MKNNQTTSPVIVNGVEVTKVATKWHFAAKTANGIFTKIISGNIGAEKVAKIAKAMGASVKRGFAGVGGIDPMANGQIQKILSPKTYKGIDFAHTVPQNAVESRKREFNNPSFNWVAFAGN